MFKFNKWRICRDDTVYILSGPDKGKTGNVLEVFKDRRLPQVIVEGRNLVSQPASTVCHPTHGNVNCALCNAAQEEGSDGTW